MSKTMAPSARTIAIEAIGAVATLVFAVISLLIIFAWGDASMALVSGNLREAVTVFQGTLLFMPLLVPYLWLRFRVASWPGPYTQRLIDAVS